MKDGTRALSPLSRSDICTLFEDQVINPDRLIEIDGVTTPDRPLPRRACFIERYDERLLRTLQESGMDSVLILAVEAYRGLLPHAHTISDLPRAQFAKLLRALFNYQQKAQTRMVAETALIHPEASVACNVIIGRDCEIGAGTFIYPSVTLGDRVRIGRNCVVGSGTVIGQPGFGVFHDYEGIPHGLPQVAGVVIGDEVQIGALNTIASGTIHPTVIRSFVKTDDQVHIAHNCDIGARTIITACAEISGSVVIGDDVWLGPNVSVRDGLAIGSKAYVGIGSNVVESIEAGATAFGNPARVRRKGGVLEA
jgi:UDP-3-O-[3-hydroxymyristoyl] glucosamine N-acyltransferase